MKMMQVQAAPGLRVPMEDKPRTHITDTESVAVPDSAYYQRRLADGDLVLQQDEAAQAAEVAEPPAADAIVDPAAAPAGKKAPKGASTNTTGA